MPMRFEFGRVRERLSGRELEIYDVISRKLAEVPSYYNSFIHKLPEEEIPEEYKVKTKFGKKEFLLSVPESIARYAGGKIKSFIRWFSGRKFTEEASKVKKISLMLRTAQFPHFEWFGAPAIWKMSEEERKEAERMAKLVTTFFPPGTFLGLRELHLANKIVLDREYGNAFLKVLKEIKKEMGVKEEKKEEKKPSLKEKLKKADEIMDKVEEMKDKQLEDFVKKMAEREEKKEEIEKIPKGVEEKVEEYFLEKEKRLWALVKKAEELGLKEVNGVKIDHLKALLHVKNFKEVEKHAERLRELVSKVEREKRETMARKAFLAVTEKVWTEQGWQELEKSEKTPVSLRDVLREIYQEVGMAGLVSGASSSDFDQFVKLVHSELLKKMYGNPLALKRYTHIRISPREIEAMKAMLKEPLRKIWYSERPLKSKIEEITGKIADYLLEHHSPDLLEDFKKKYFLHNIIGPEHEEIRKEVLKHLGPAVHMREEDFEKVRGKIRNLLWAYEDGKKDAKTVAKEIADILKPYTA